MDSSEGKKGPERPGRGSPIVSPKNAIDRVKQHFGGGGRGLPPSRPAGNSQDDEEEHMLRMSFLEHLEELRARIIRALIGAGVAFLVSLTFSNE